MGKQIVRTNRDNANAVRTTGRGLQPECRILRSTQTIEFATRRAGPPLPFSRFTLTSSTKKILLGIRNRNTDDTYNERPLHREPAPVRFSGKHFHTIGMFFFSFSIRYSPFGDHSGFHTRFRLCSPSEPPDEFSRNEWEVTPSRY